MQWGSPAEFCAMGGYGLCVDFVRRHGPVHGVGKYSQYGVDMPSAAAESRDRS